MNSEIMVHKYQTSLVVFGLEIFVQQMFNSSLFDKEMLDILVHLVREICPRGHTFRTSLVDQICRTSLVDQICRTSLVDQIDVHVDIFLGPNMSDIFSGPKYAAKTKLAWTK